MTFIAPRIGLFGPFDTVLYGDLLLPLIFEREIRRRLPAASLSFYAPEGWGRAVATKGGVIAEPFGRWSAAHSAELASSFDLIAVTDEDSRRRLEALGIDQSIHVVPDARLLVADLFSRDVLDRRLRQLRAIGAYPEQGRPLVVHGTSIPDTSSASDVVFLAMNPDDEIAARSLRGTRERKVYVLDSNATVQDITAAIAQAHAFSGTSPEFATTASAFGIPLVGSQDRADLRDQLTRLSRHFDRLAEIAEASAAQRSNAGVADLQRREIASLTARSEALRNAHQALRERMAAERALFAEAVNRSSDGEVTPASLVIENAHLLRGWSDTRHWRVAAERDLERARAELASVREENERHRLVLRTKIVSAALRVQRLLARLRGK